MDGCVYSFAHVCVCLVGWVMNMVWWGKDVLEIFEFFIKGGVRIYFKFNLWRM